MFSFSIVKEITGSMEFNLPRNSDTQSFLTMTKLSSTYRFQILGRTHGRNNLHTKVGDDWTNRASHGTNMYLFVETIIIGEEFGTEKPIMGC